jgi:hypothetical protein
MDTIKNVATSASNAIFGNNTEQSETEPVSGQTGAGTVDEPYDKGNIDGGGKYPIVGKIRKGNQDVQYLRHTLSDHSTAIISRFSLTLLLL